MPRVAIVMPAYRSGLTIERSLVCLSRQTWSDFEFVLVESGPEISSDALLEGILPGATHLRLPGRWLPHAAINQGLAHTSADLLVFIDSDAYAPEDWLERLLDAYRDGHPVVAGSVACFSNTWFGQAAHLAKFDKWLTGLPQGIVREAPTINFLVERSVYEAHGPFLNETIHADTAFCWRLSAAGVPIWFAPEAVVAHHHVQAWLPLLKERYDRGRSFGESFRGAPEVAERQVGLRVAMSVLPVRLVHQLLRVGRHAWQSREYRAAFFLTLPATASLLYAWLLGEAQAGLRTLFRAAGKT